MNNFRGCEAIVKKSIAPHLLLLRCPRCVGEQSSSRAECTLTSTMARRLALFSLLIYGACAFTARPLRHHVPTIASHGVKQHHGQQQSQEQQQRHLLSNRSDESRTQFALSVVSGGASAETGDESSPSRLAKVRAFTSKNFFLLGMIAAVSLAKTFPDLGKNGGLLRPELFIGKFGVTCIFLLSGLSLELSELSQAIKNFKLNGLTQFASFGLWPLFLGLPLTKGLELFVPGLLPKPLLDGLLVMSCLPTTVNMCLILATQAGGNMATALCNAVIGNIFGIFATPALLLRLLGTSIDLPFVQMIVKLCNKVLVPVVIGQGLRATPAKTFYSNNKKIFKRLQEYILLGIVWNAFCNAFAKGMGLGATQSAALLILMPILHLTSIGGLFALFTSKVANFTKGEVVAATYCASHKTLAFGLPLISTIFEGNPNLAAYTAPIMIMHPTQLILGSILAPKFKAYIEKNENENAN